MLSAFYLSFAHFCFGQNSLDSAHSSGAWGGTGKVCNVCHEPFNVKYSIKQTPYWNHQVNATTFRGNKLDGSPVLIKSDKGGDKCLNCHKSDDNLIERKSKISKNEFEVWHP
jgi:hypothetical protein